MLIPVYEAEKRWTDRAPGREPRVIAASRVREYAPIRRREWADGDDLVVIAPARNPSFVVVAPPGSWLGDAVTPDVRRVRMLFVPLPDGGHRGIEALWAVGLARIGYLGLRLRDEVAGPAGGGEDADLDAGAGAEALAVDAAIRQGPAVDAAEHPAVEPEPAGVGGGGSGPADGWLF